MSDDMVEMMIGTVTSFGKKAAGLIMMAPSHLLFTIPYMFACWLRADKAASLLASILQIGKRKRDPASLEAWARGLYKNSENFMVNFDLIDQYRRHAVDPKKYPSAYIPVPPNLERGVFIGGRMFNGQTKDHLFTGQSISPELVADAYAKTSGRALLVGILSVIAPVTAILMAIGKYIDIQLFTYETWGELGEASSFSLGALLGSGMTSLVVLALALIPLLFVKKLIDGEHDVLALNEVIADIRSQMLVYGGFEASKEEAVLAATASSRSQELSETLAKQRLNFWRVHKDGEPYIYLNTDDGVARARCSVHGYEAGTPILLVLSDLMQNLLCTGKIGSGKTTSVGLPTFDRIIESFTQAGYPIQGFGLDGKATIYHNLMRILVRQGVSTEKFIPIGVEEGQYGVPIFHGLSVEKCVDILASTTRGEADPFFVPSALSQIERVLRIAKAYHLTPMGVTYEIESGGCTVDSPDFVKRLCNNPDVLYAIIEELTGYLKGNELARHALYDPSLKSAIDGCLEDWRNMLKAQETASSVVSTINVFLKDFTGNGKILERFGQGRVGDMYKDLSLCLNGHFFFSALADTEYGEAARKINIFARSRLFNLITLREIEYKRVGKNPQREPVLVFIDEHHAMASSGTTGLSDASIMNISRSMGMIFIAMTQSTDAYITVLGEKQTENMVQQMLTRFYLPTKSQADMDNLRLTSGDGYSFGVYQEGVAESEGHRELANGGVMAVPRTQIRKLSRVTPLGMPSTVSHIEKEKAERREYGAPTFGLLGFMGVFELTSGVDYIDQISSPKTIKRMKEPNKFTFAGAFGAPDQSIQNELSKAFEKEAEIEQRGRADGVKQIPLFTNQDLIESGNFRAVLSVPQYGVEHICRTTLEPLYI